ncbi:hypothetical protein [Candidatus Pristimantibacillus sp. PTI5]|uniref:hypothetical protein n=1 Tax=Candidatus Pristimantibacillus sp. PTI5 TaxID=3400422 RepID=UPI003B0270D2
MYSAWLMFDKDTKEEFIIFGDEIRVKNFQKENQHRVFGSGFDGITKEEMSTAIADFKQKHSKASVYECK